jgi:hypothetical protein
MVFQFEVLEDTPLKINVEMQCIASLYVSPKIIFRLIQY